jgi:hypothetical protein
MKKTFKYGKAAILCLLTLSVASTTVEAQRGHHYYNSYGYGGGYYPVRAQYFGHIPEPYISLNFGGYPYYYSGGLFYQPYGSSFQLIAPPFGIRVGFLPQGYWPLNWGGYPYYYYNGIFYRPDNREYEVVQAPVGAEVPSIPREARAVVIDGRKYYEYNGTYFSDFVKPNGEIWYRVDGKHGVLNTDRNNNNNNVPPPANLQPHTYNVPRTTLPSQQQSNVPPVTQPTTVQQSPQPVVTQEPTASSQQQPVQTEEIRTSKQPTITQDTKTVQQPAVTQQPVTAPPPASTTETRTVQQGRTSQQPISDKPTIGEVFDSLPADSKTVVINSKKYFLSPDNLYYEEVMDGKQLRYKVSGRVM